jgi:hypothetical protein
LWNAETGERLKVLEGHAGQVTAIAFSPNDQFCFTGDSNGRGMLWRTETGEALRRLSWHTSKIVGAAFLADGQRLVTASDDKTVAQWNTARLAEDPESVARVIAGRPYAARDQPKPGDHIDHERLGADLGLGSRRGPAHVARGQNGCERGGFVARWASSADGSSRR